ncbi:unnamed protein product [Prorocentrum cordatum]|uniref:Uncharacterized protein n=1 Tax=Prorocentrum cordatum TaxID=2364126 RepID=A0ABN9U1E8_9DINO|nr:unnamed protein product [Polarella glacialis]
MSFDCMDANLPHRHSPRPSLESAPQTTMRPQSPCCTEDVASKSKRSRAGRGVLEMVEIAMLEDDDGGKSNPPPNTVHRRGESVYGSQSPNEDPVKPSWSCQ